MSESTIKIPCTTTIGYMIYGFTVLGIVCVIVYLRIKSKEKEKNENKMSDTYPSNAPLRSVSKQEADCKYLLRDYYIKSAYNCCAVNRFKNSYVSKEGVELEVIEYKEITIEEKILILDEPTRNLDPNLKNYCKQLILQHLNNHKNIIIITHDKELEDIMDDMIYL